MRNEKITYTCDRCGREIKKPWEILVREVDNTYMIFHISDLINKMTKQYPDDDWKGYFSVSEIDENGMTVKLNSVKNDKSFDLCPACKRAFKNFMKNKDVKSYV